MNYKIAVLPGDGIGPEVMGEGTQVLGQVAKLYGFGVELVQEHHHDHPHRDDERY
jgi:3-isopropylmalate dehydrogenase